MKYFFILSLMIVSLFLSNCAGNLSQYKIIKLKQVETIKSKSTGMDLTVIIEEPYTAFEEVIERSPNVKSVTRITDLKGNKEPSFFALSPISSDIVFQATEEINNSYTINLWKTSTKGVAGMTRLTAGRYYDMEPAFSSDGRNIFFSSNRSSSTPKLFKISTEGATGLTRLTQSQTEDRFPSIDNQTGRIFYMSIPNSNYEWQIWYIDSNGSLSTQLKEGIWPHISPDGNMLLYCSKDQKNDKWKIWKMNTDGTNQTQLTSDSESDDLYPCWSANGKLIVYASDIGKDSNGKKNFDIYVMNVNGERNTQLTTNGSTDLMPRISSDNKYIYFLSNRGFSWDIWRLSIGGQ